MVPAPREAKMSHGSVAAKYRQDKENYPESYCQEPRCLWRLSSGPCRKHAQRIEVREGGPVDPAPPATPEAGATIKDSN